MKKIACLFVAIAMSLSLGVSPARAADVDAADVGSSGGYIKDHHQPRVIVFVHGLFSNQEAWRCDGKNYWPAMIAVDKDPAFAGTDVYVVSYPTPEKHGRMSIPDLYALIENRLESDGVFLRHREVVFVAHSLGGLVTQQLLLTYRDKDKELYKKVSFIYLYGTPQEGSKLANIGKHLKGDPLLPELQQGDGNFLLHDMDSKWQHAGFDSIERFCAYETRPEHGFRVVDRNSATRGCKDAVPIDADHQHIVRPCDTRSDSYIALKNKLASDTFNNPQPERIAAGGDQTLIQQNSGGTNFQIGTLNAERPGRRLTKLQMNQMIEALKSSSAGSLVVVLEMPVTQEMKDFGDQLRSAAEVAGWRQSGVTEDPSTARRMSYRGRSTRFANGDPGTHCTFARTALQSSDAVGVFHTALTNSGVSCPAGAAEVYPLAPGSDVTVYVSSFLE